VSKAHPFDQAPTIQHLKPWAGKDPMGYAHAIALGGFVYAEFHEKECWWRVQFPDDSELILHCPEDAK